VKCIACHKSNNLDDRFCAACGSSLDLKLCHACEAINNPVADHCHNCGKSLSDEPVAAVAPTAPQTVVQAALVVESPPFYAPRQWQVRETRPSAAQQIGRWAKRTFFVALPLVAIAIWAHQFYGQRVVPAAKPVVFEGKLPAAIAKPPVAQVAKPAPDVKRAPKAVAAPEQALTQSNAGATTAVAAPVAPVVQSKPVVQKKPVVIEAAPPVVSRARVTHTRAAPAAAAGKLEEAGESAPVATEPVAGASVAGAPAARAAPAAGNCPPPVAVLGLCNANVKGDGK
jgi:hypothetical protein